MTLLFGERSALSRFREGPPWRNRSVSPLPLPPRNPPCQSADRPAAVAATPVGCPRGQPNRGSANPAFTICGETHLCDPAACRPPVGRGLPAMATGHPNGQHCNARFHLCGEKVGLLTRSDSSLPRPPDGERNCPDHGGKPRSVKSAPASNHSVLNHSVRDPLASVPDARPGVVRAETSCSGAVPRIPSRRPWEE